MVTRTTFRLLQRALQKVLGDEKNVITYVDDIVLHSPGFDDHLATLDSVLHKLTSAGFNINASKCHFCRPEIKSWDTLSVTAHYVQTRGESKLFFRILRRKARNNLESS